MMQKHIAPGGHMPFMSLSPAPGHHGMFGRFELAAVLRLQQLECLFVGNLVQGWKLCCDLFISGVRLSRTW